MTEWGVKALELEAYLARIGLAGREFGPTVDALRELHRAHVLSIPFENVDVTLARPVGLDLPSIQEKLVRQRRGGFCHEHNLLFAAALAQLGFDVRRVLTRVRDDGQALLPRGHSALLVDVDEQTWLADVGYGCEGLLEPVPLVAGVFAQGGWRFELARVDGSWRLRADGAIGPVLYSVGDAEYRRPDFEMACYFLSNHPSSPFATNLVVQRVTDTARYALFGYELVITLASGQAARQVLTERTLRSVLADTFGIELSADETATVNSFVARRPVGAPSL